MMEDPKVRFSRYGRIAGRECQVLGTLGEVSALLGAKKGQESGLN
jgi:hypothetical protein